MWAGLLAVTPLEVTLEEWLLGPQRNAALVGGPSRAGTEKTWHRWDAQADHISACSRRANRW